MPDQILLETKLDPQPTSARMVVRGRLFDRLTIAPDSCLILVSAPAGYGKTIAMRALRERWVGAGCQAAWISLDTGDNDPVRFAAYLIAAFRRSLPELFPDGGWSSGSLESTAIQVINRLAETDGIHALILDDYHLIASQAVHNAVNLLLENLPPRFRLVIGSRGDPPLQLSRLRVRQRLVEVRTADLRFSSEEVGTFWEQVFGVRPSSQSISLLEACTEGWAAGLQLASTIIAQRHPAPNDLAISGLAAQLAGTDGSIFDYLAEEVLNHQPEEVQSLLMATSILSRFNARLSHALAGNGNGVVQFHDLDRESLFISSMDGDSNWYRYHHLFRDFLQTRLAQTRPNQVRELHRTAAKWFAQQGDFMEGLEHALVGQDFELAARLFTEHVWEPLISKGELMTLLRWTDAFPEEALKNQPRLAILASHVLTQVGQHRRAMELMDAAARMLDAADQNDPCVQHDSGILDAFQSMAAMASGRPRRALELAGRAAQMMTPDDRLISIQVARTKGFIYYNLGDMKAAIDSLQTAMRLSRELGQHYWLLESAHWLILSYIKMGNLTKAYSLCNELENAYPPDFGPIACVLAPAAIIATEFNQLVDAELLFKRSLEMARREKLMDALWISCIGLARVQMFKGDLDDIALLVEEGLRAARGIGSQVVLSIAGTVAARAALARGDFESAQSWADSYVSQRPSEYPAELEDLTLATVWISVGKTKPALEILDDMLAPIREAQRHARLIEAQILRTTIFEQLGSHEEADSALSEALSLGEPQGYLRTFINCSSMIEGALRRAEVDYPDYVRRILASAKSQNSYTGLNQLDGLTEREAEVLRLLARGASNQDIANTLVIGIGTVKSHMNHIMSKLNARNRTEAVAIARLDGLIV